MQAISIGDKRPPWEWRAGVGVGGRGGIIKVPRAQLGSKEKRWTGRVLEAGEKEGNGSQAVAGGAETLRDS